MSAGHTPGPWVIDENRWDGAVTIINDRHEPVLSAAWEGGSQTSLRVSEADLRLIVASPALLEALEEQIGECFDPLCDMCARHAEIIAQAKGESA